MKHILFALFIFGGVCVNAQTFQIRNPGPGGSPTQGMNYPVDLYTTKNGTVLPNFQAATITNTDADSTAVVTVTGSNINYTISIPPNSAYRWPATNLRPYIIKLTVASHTADLYIQVIY